MPSFERSGGYRLIYFQVKIMSKEQKTNKEVKKKPLLTAKEKKAAKKEKKDTK